MGHFFSKSKTDKPLEMLPPQQIDITVLDPAIVFSELIKSLPVSVGHYKSRFLQLFEQVLNSADRSEFMTINTDIILPNWKPEGESLCFNLYLEKKDGKILLDPINYDNCMKIIAKFRYKEFRTAGEILLNLLPLVNFERKFQ